MKRILVGVLIAVLVAVAADAVTFFILRAKFGGVVQQQPAAGQAKKDQRQTQAAQQPAPEPLKTATMIAVGDIMLSRSVAFKIRANGADYPFAATRDYLHSADIVFANLEDPITTGPVIKPGDMFFHADPGVQDALARAGFNLLNLANNHVPNFGDQGILDTLKYLDSAGIKHFGAGKNLGEADAAVYMEENGVKFAFLGYNDSDVVPASYGASAGRPGTNIMDLEKVSRDVRAAKQNADIVIVSMHSGIEYKPNPDQHQIDFAHAAIDAGAEAVIGHHPHVIENVERYKGKYIFYSLGNFVFDQAFSKDVREGMTLKLTFAKSGLSQVEYHPIWIEDLSQPRLVDNDPVLAAEELNRLGAEK